MLGVSKRRACKSLGIARSLAQYHPTRPEAGAKLVRRRVNASLVVDIFAVRAVVAPA